MPIYEYEPTDRECVLCDGRVAILQRADEAAEPFCPYCGLEVTRVFSPASIIVRKGNLAERGARGNFTTWRKSTAGTWDKVDGPGVDHLVGTDEDMAKVKETSTAPKVFEV